MNHATTFPRGCEVGGGGYGFDKNNLILNNSGQQTLFLMQNHSEISIQLEHIENVEVFMSPKLEAHIGPQQWAAFASDIANTNFRCSQSIEGQSVTVDCKDYLTLCQYPRVKFALSNKGNYWISTNKSMQQVIQEATKKGIFLHW